MFAPAGRFGANGETTSCGLQSPLGNFDYFALLNGDQMINVSNSKYKS